MRGAARHPDRLSVQQSLAQMKLLLVGCTDAALGRMTVDRLVGTYRVEAKRAEYELTIERQRRARNAT